MNILKSGLIGNEQHFNPYIDKDKNLNFDYQNSNSSDYWRISKIEVNKVNIYLIKLQ